MVFCNDALAGLHIVISGGCGAIGVGIVKKIDRTRCKRNSERYFIVSTCNSTAQREQD